MILGIDTSNYTTSCALFDTQSGKMISEKKLLPVKAGEVGLMQSQALFEHIRQLPGVLEAAFSSFCQPPALEAVCVSAKPRNQAGSYMPVFLAGVCTAKSIAAAQHIPCFETAHQIGHVAAALFSIGRLDLLQKKFIAFHVSGGTTEALLVQPDEKHILRCEIVARSLDLKIGQLIDRVGVMLGLPFPAGGELDRLSCSGKLPKKPKVTLKGADCCVSGLQNQCEEMLKEGVLAPDIAKFVVESVYAIIRQMTEQLRLQYGNLPFVYAGGVMRNTLVSERLSEQGGLFAKPEFSSDNAAGTALIGSIFYQKQKERNGENG